MGRHGPLTEREMATARAAWQYFVYAYQEETGLANSVGAFPSTTLWDTASYIGALVAAYELGIIDKRAFDDRAFKLIATIRNLELFRGELPNKVYHAKTGEKVNYANKKGEIGYSALDIGRFLVWMRILKERYPYLANGIDNIVLGWNFCNVIDEEGGLVGAMVNKKTKKVKYLQEGRLGYEEYAAKGFALWGFDVAKAKSPVPYAFTNIYGVDVPYDPRDPRVFQTKNSVLMESYLLDGLEMGWDEANDKNTGGDVASHGWRAEFASRVYLAQERRFEETGIMTARSEHQVNGSPYFVYDTIFADGYAWNTVEPSGAYQPTRAAVSGKAAIGMWALWKTDYTDRLFDLIADLYDPEKGMYEGLYEDGSGKIPLQTANNNGIILAALLFKAQGPILRYENTDTQVWDTAFENRNVRKKRCLPEPTKTPEELAQPEVTVENFQICRPVNNGQEIGATQCSVANLRRRSVRAEPLDATAQVSNPGN
ncbi:DUF3131 domain-containing protein [Jiella mangrovi]|uniref:DUF3131 domain-containing protein n=1 Tax=Jiella mangrovi TaxID=2821407 RepID=A0ABS4BCE1_9HYPH|nr:DUF3131 domain-containing protein [Jiella mangrovi]MBP0614441.1 DUF3131 domain-containing protein [Jiella mangrovi]